MIESLSYIRRLAIVSVFLLGMGLVGCGNRGNDAGTSSRSTGTETNENISYADDTELAFSNNKILLFSVSGADKDEVTKALGQYGAVDASNAGAGMYVVSVEGHLGATELSDMIDDIVEREPLIEAGSINWSLPDQAKAEKASGNE